MWNCALVSPRGSKTLFNHSLFCWSPYSWEIVSCLMIANICCTTYLKGSVKKRISPFVFLCALRAIFLFIFRNCVYFQKFPFAISHSFYFGQCVYVCVGQFRDSCAHCPVKFVFANDTVSLGVVYASFPCVPLCAYTTVITKTPGPDRMDTFDSPVYLKCTQKDPKLQSVAGLCSSLWPLQGFPFPVPFLPLSLSVLLQCKTNVHN